ncbi:MAG TPA: TraB/GumN family protein [Allosphingosinicella sp.]|jgi:uncharacterized protein YbaP (TraB family)
MTKWMMRATVVAAIMLVPAAVPAAEPQRANAEVQQAEEILVVGRRSGAPMWRVTGPETTIILVGGINGVSRTTKWDPEALMEALRRADRVMFPQSMALTASPFNAIGWLIKWKKMGSLPKNQNLGQFVAPDHMRRLAALEARGLAKDGYESRHPLHLAQDLQDRAKGEIDYSRNAAEYVARAVKRYKLPVTVDPIAKGKAKPVVKDLFASSPSEHVPCLIDSIAAAEAGPAAVQARSDAWAARRVKEVLASPVEGFHNSCWPHGAGLGPSREDLVAQMRQLLSEKRVTVAVLGLRSLAEKGGILDSLEAAGYDVLGPEWK